MMREMSYRDKMILLIISAIIILAVGFFALIRPKYNTLVADKVLYEDAKTEMDGLQQKIDQIPTIQSNITEIYNESKKMGELFVNDAFSSVNDTFDNQKANYILADYLAETIEECELKVSSYSISGISNETLDYYYHTPDILTYSLLEAADVNGNYAEEVTEILKESNYLSSRETAEVMTNTIELSVEGTKENLMNFLTAIQEDDNAVMITSLDITDYQFGAGEVSIETYEVTDEEGNVTTQTREVTQEGDGSSELNISITFYNAKVIDQPDLGD